MRISDWSSDVCSSDLLGQCRHWLRANNIAPVAHSDTAGAAAWVADSDEVGLAALAPPHAAELYGLTLHGTGMEDADHNMTRFVVLAREPLRSEEHTSELQSLMRISYAVFCLNKKIKKIITQQERRWRYN